MKYNTMTQNCIIFFHLGLEYCILAESKLHIHTDDYMQT